MESAKRNIKKLFSKDVELEYLKADSSFGSEKAPPKKSILGFASKIFRPTFTKIGFIAGIFFITALFVAKSTITVHSDSDVSYRQESVFAGAGLSATAQSLSSEINPEPIGIDEIIEPITMSFEVDQVTPTPTPLVDPIKDDIWIKLAQCESRQNWSIDTGNGYYGGLQFSLGAWGSVGGVGKPSEASKEEQIERGKMLQAKRGWGVWGACAKKLGLN